MTSEAQTAIVREVGLRDGLQSISRVMAQWLEGETLHGSLWRAGLPKTMLATA